MRLILADGEGRVESSSLFVSRPRPQLFFHFRKIQVFKMARPRKPTNVLELTGAFKKDPQRRREDAEPVGELTAPPAHINGAVLHAWKEIAKYAPRDVLTNSDRLSLELAANLLAQFRNDPLDFPAAKLVRLEAMLGKFGMTPADRSKVGGGKKDAPKGNAFAEL